MGKVSFHKLLCIFILIVFASMSLILSGCKFAQDDDSMFINIENATFSNDDAKQSYIVNRYDYVSWIDHLPKAEDLIAPNGKVFAGWYFDSDCSEGNSYTFYNWEQKAIKNDKPSSLYAYAKWIDLNYVNVILDVDNNEASFLKNGLKSTEMLILRSEIDDILDVLPTQNDVSLKSSTLDGWSLTTSYAKKEKSVATASEIQKAVETNSYVNLQAKWTYNSDLIIFRYDVITTDGSTATINLDHFISYYLDNFTYDHPYAQRVITDTVNKKKTLSCSVFKDDPLSLMQSYSPSIDDIIVTNSNAKYKVAGYKIRTSVDDYSDWTEDYISEHSIYYGFYVSVVLERM